MSLGPLAAPDVGPQSAERVWQLWMKARPLMFKERLTVEPLTSVSYIIVPLAFFSLWKAFWLPETPLALPQVSIYADTLWEQERFMIEVVNGVC